MSLTIRLLCRGLVLCVLCFKQSAQNEHKMGRYSYMSISPRFWISQCATFSSLSCTVICENSSEQTGLDLCTRHCDFLQNCYTSSFSVDYVLCVIIKYDLFRAFETKARCKVKWRAHSAAARPPLPYRKFVNAACNCTCLKVAKSGGESSN